MESFTKETVKNLFKKQGFSPKKELGQNFLIDNKAINLALKAAQINKNDIVLEIGPGIGNLTLEMAKNAKKVIAIEKDGQMSQVLQKLLETEQIKNAEVVAGDIRNFKPTDLNLKANNYKVIANIPYYLTAFLIRTLLESKVFPKDVILIIQKEVAQRICAKPPKMNLLAVSVQFYAQPKIMGYLKKNSFWPKPKVDSAIIKITPRNTTAKTDINSLLFFKIVKAGFSQPRKQLLNNLSKGLEINKEKITAWLLKNNIDPHQRAETLSLADWEKLTVDFFF